MVREEISFIFEARKWYLPVSVSMPTCLMLQVNPEKRVKIEELLDHDWVMTGYASPVRWHSRIKVNKQIVKKH